MGKYYLGETCLAEAPVCHAVLPGHACAQVIQETTFLTNQSQTSYEEQMVQVIHPAVAGTLWCSSRYPFCAKQNVLKYKNYVIALEARQRVRCQIYRTQVKQVNLCDRT